KEAGFEVTDHIRLFVEGNAEIAQLALRNAEGICGDTLTDELIAQPDGSAAADNAKAGAYTKELDINGKLVNVSVKKL
ncbi:MAG: hypothetical protein J6X19_04920, partial [Clostridia bacterium]|nr:hypothetical protein [Clostridia bacterium]